MSEPLRVMVNGRAGGTLDPLDRGLAYGDGLFETILAVDGRAPLWLRHMARLAEGCARLGLPPPDPAQLAAELDGVVAGLARAAVRVTLTRGSGPRGYAPVGATATTRIVAAFAAPTIAAHVQRQGIRVRLCDLRLAAQPRLAGIKHLNRLEQVLARAEWDDPAVGEGLLLDTEGRLISATAANLFLCRDGRPMTPALDRCGVAGVARAEVLALRPDCLVRELGTDDLMHADEVFLTSSLRGVMPVTRLGDRQWPVGPVARALQRHWRGMDPAGAAA
ncbi:MAG: aminodeoxychorismate lyase [Xanthomonadales bacterium]|nr:aminodeoxychorismate lyase [Xanthomonadales bacterium]